MRSVRTMVTGGIALRLAVAAIAILPLAAGATEELRPSAADLSVVEEMRSLFGTTGSMAPGMPGNIALENEIEKRFAASGFTNGALRFTAPVFVPGKTSICLSNEAPIRLYPMHPTLYRPGNFTESEFQASLVYLGKGEYSDLAAAKGTDLNNAIALMDFDCGYKWMELLRFGIKGFVFIGQSSYHYSDSHGKIYNTEVAVPRFFVEAADGAKLKSASLSTSNSVKSVSAAVHSEPSRMATSELKDLWVLIPGSDPALNKETILFTARMDANSVVPELATGAQTAVNPYLLLKMLADFTTKPPKRSVILAAVNAHTQSYLGERILAWHLLADSSDIAKVRGEMAREMRIARLYNENYSQLQLEPVKLQEDKLFAAIELMWQLDAQQQSRITTEVKPVQTELTNAPTTAAALKTDRYISEVDTNAVLNLSGFSDADYRIAIDRAITSMHEVEKGSVYSRTMRDDKMAKAIRQELAWVENLKTMSPEEVRALVLEAKPVFDDEKLFESWRTELDASSGQRLSVKKELQNAAKKMLAELQQQRLYAHRDKTLSDAERSKLVAEIDAKKQNASRVLVMFNKIDFGIGRRRIRYRAIVINEAQRTLLKSYRDALTDKYSLWQRMHRERLEADAACDSIRNELKGRKIVLTVCLEMTGNSDKLAFSPDIPGEWRLNFGKYLAAMAVNLSSNRAAGSNPYVDALAAPAANANTLQPKWLHTADSATMIFAAAKGGDQGSGTPAISLKNALGDTGLSFSPCDTFDKLNPRGIDNQLTWLGEYLPMLLNDPNMTTIDNLNTGQIGFDPGRGLWSILVGAFAMEEMSADISPTKAIPDAMVVLYSKMGSGTLLLDGDVVNCYANLSDVTGRTVIYGVADSGGMAPVAYQMDSNYREVLNVMDKGRIQTSMQMKTNIERDSSKTLPLFPCREFPVYDRIDPTLVGTEPITINEVWPKNGDSKANPAKCGASGIGMADQALVWSHASVGPVAVYLSRKPSGRDQEPLMLITAGKRCALNSSTEKPEGIGYASQAEWSPDFFATAARDMDYLNHFRRDRLKGVENSLVAQFLDQGGESLKEMDKAKAARDHTAFQLASYKALGNEVKAYMQLGDMNNDMLKAILIYMALMLPFCYFIQKLLFGLDKLQHELLAFSACFIGMYILFRFIHPAFAVAQTPEAIFIAFVLGAVGAFVTSVMHSRFKGEMQLIFGKTSGIGEDASYSTVSSTAMTIGIHNMRRRRVRTTLTTATVVLVVFTMLAFSSVSQRRDPTLIKKAADAPYTGLFYHWPVGKNMDEQTVSVLKNIFTDSADVLVRRNSIGGPWTLERSGGTTESGTNNIGIIASVVGLPANDEVFMLSMPLLAGRFFSSSNMCEILLPSSLAETMHITSADVGKLTMKFRGLEPLLVGIVDDQRLRLVRDLNPNLAFLPFKPETIKAARTDQGASDSDGENAVASAVLADTAAMVLLPENLAAKLGTPPSGASIRFRSDTLARKDFKLYEYMERLLAVTHARFFVGSEIEFMASPQAKRPTSPGVYFMNSNYGIAIGGLARLLIPLLIAGTIILNTMLGTVYERKSEISIYNAIGLNPTHIFMFFLAEAFVYSFIGSVGGYLIGQSLAMTLQHFHLVKDIGVNFSSLMVVYAILFTIALVLLSTIYPAYVATRTAVPSGKRRWDMPTVEDNSMHVAFPFIYQGSLSSGVMYYIYEDFLTCSEKSLSSLIATFESKSVTADANGRPVYSMVYSVGLSPFDLGVTQRVKLQAQYEDAVKSYRLHMTVEHLTGLDTNWVALNRFFLERMRGFLMVWRNMDPTMYAWYSECGEKLFKDQPLPQRPVAAGDGDEKA